LKIAKALVARLIEPNFEKFPLRLVHPSKTPAPARHRRGFFICASANLRQPEHLAGFRIDQVLPRAKRAGDGLISLAIAFGRIVSDPALHVQACIWAAVDEWRHYAAYSEFWISTTGGLPVTYRKF
jgi:hypothetical protein